MKKLFAWLCMVALFAALVVCGAVAFLYQRASLGDVPPAQVQFAGQELEPNGYSWGVPVLGGVLYRTFEQSSTLTVQDLGVLATASPSLTLGEGLPAGACRLTVTGPGGGIVYEGSAEGFAQASLPQNGAYEVLLTAGRVKTGEKPAQPIGFYRYKFRCTLSVEPTLTLSAAELPRGGVFAVYVSGVLDQGVQPTAQCGLGQVWFAPWAGGWLGFVPVAYNAEAGAHPLTVTVGTRTLTAELTVRHRDFAKVETTEEESATPDGAAQQFRDKIWPLYTTGAPEVRWSGAFTTPVEGKVALDYGVYEYVNGSKGAQRSSGVEFEAEQGSQVACPAPGTVVFADPLLLTGNTVVVDHGCGLKSYLYNLGSLSVSAGAQVAQGDTLGFVGSEHINYELKIANKSIDPWDAWRGEGGLFYRPAQ